MGRVRGVGDREPAQNSARTSRGCVFGSTLAKACRMMPSGPIT
jgi:hypothetical protein